MSSGYPYGYSNSIPLYSTSNGLEMPSTEATGYGYTEYPTDSMPAEASYFAPQTAYSMPPASAYHASPNLLDSGYTYATESSNIAPNTTAYYPSSLAQEYVPQQEEPTEGAYPSYSLTSSPEYGAYTGGTMANSENSEISNSDNRTIFNFIFQFANQIAAQSGGNYTSSTGSSTYLVTPNPLSSSSTSSSSTSSSSSTGSLISGLHDISFGSF